MENRFERKFNNLYKPESVRFNALIFKLYFFGIPQYFYVNLFDQSASMCSQFASSLNSYPFAKIPTGAKAQKKHFWFSSIKSSVFFVLIDYFAINFNQLSKFILWLLFYR